MNYRDFLQKKIYAVINPLIKGMIRIGITPNIVTAIGFVGNVLAMTLFFKAALLEDGVIGDGQATSTWKLIGWGGVVILFAGLFDMMDGRLARMGGMSSAFGALWDSTLDRYSELVTLFGICMIFMSKEWIWMTFVTFLALTGSIMVSYVRARAEGIGIECKVGLMQRPERVVVTALAAIAASLTHQLCWLAGGMILIAVLANITAGWRLWHCYRVMNGQRTSQPEES